MLILYLAVLITAVYFVIKLLAPEIRKPSLPVPRPMAPPTEGTFLRTEKLEMMLAEKNKNIQHLQTELKALYVQTHEFDKLKDLWEEEIQRLREQNRIFRSELGLPTVQPKENSVIL